MRSSVEIRFRPVAVAAAALLVAGVVSWLVSGVALADPVTGSDANGTYLALGDSVAFGYVPPQAVPAPKYQVAHSFVGYPEYLAQQLDERVWNASCPGETTASMLTPGAQSNGCENSVGSPVGYRTLNPLHVQYQGTQVEFALSYLAVHKHTRLITIDIGANDAFVCQATTADHCTSMAELAGVAAVIANVTTAYGGIVANGFAAFQAPSAAFGGSPCAAGLLIKLPNGTCNIHPSPEGHQLLAAAIAKAIGA